MYRIIDVNINRVCEGLRVIEDYLRFTLNNNNYLKIKKFRHFLREKVSILVEKKLITHRDSINDLGNKSDEIEINRKNETDIVKANLLRVMEGLRVLEEYSKLEENLRAFLNEIKMMRFFVYELEKEILLLDKIDFSIYLRIELISNDIDKAINKIKELYDKYKMTAIELDKHLLTEKDFYNFSLKIKEFFSDKFSLFIKNNITVAKEIDSSGLVIDKDFLPLEVIRRDYSKKIGYYCYSIEDEQDLEIDRYDFIIAEKLYPRNNYKSLDIILPKQDEQHDNNFIYKIYSNV